ncbi:hypothetical protein NAL90_07080 [Burkholderia gladioli]|nr:hypothetical protein [Burkholderia gladioli]URV26168.1 hypothetical protein NAL90_07080 [Burkholderia gladioli]
MSVGLQLWDEQSRPVLDGTTRAGRVSGVIIISRQDTDEPVQWRAGQSGSVPADLSGGTPFWAFTPDWQFAHVSGNTPVPIVHIDANGIRWSYSASSGSFRNAMPGTLVFGVY